MSSALILGYYASLKRRELPEVNHELDRRSLSQVQISQFKKDGVLVIEDIFHALEISNARLAFHNIESLMKNETVSHNDINLEAPGAGWKGQRGAINSHPGTIRKIMNLIDHGDSFKALAIHPSFIITDDGTSRTQLPPPFEGVPDEQTPGCLQYQALAPG
ncbi:hypothetical protein FBULB1_1082 [Fusarium bulbicola]|nr:hypothetical protein FBULB1_1082 [Fusarium bulbicola]